MIFAVFPYHVRKAVGGKGLQGKFREVFRTVHAQSIARAVRRFSVCGVCRKERCADALGALQGEMKKQRIALFPFRFGEVALSVFAENK